MHITLITDRIGLTKPQSVDFDGALLDFLIQRFGADGPGRPISCYKDCGAGKLEEIPREYEKLNASYDSVIVATNPAGLDPITWVWIAYAALSVASFVLIRPPSLNNQTEGSNRKQSPNNSLDVQTNLARRLQRIPDIFGKVRSYPDLIAESTFRYVDQVKVITEVFCIGRGYYDISDFKSGETPIADIEGAALELFDPVVSIFDLEKVENSSGVVDLTIAAQNENFITNKGRIGDWNGEYDAVNDIGTITDTTVNDAFAFAQPGDTLELVDVRFTHGPAVSSDVSGTYTVFSATGNTVSFSNAATVAGAWGNLTSPPNPSTGLGSITKIDQVFVGPLVVPGQDYSAVIIDVDAPQGLAKGTQLDEFIEIDLEVSIQEIDGNDSPILPPVTTTVSVSGRNRDPRFYTFEITSGITVGKRYRFFIHRLTDALNDETSVEKVRLTRMGSLKTIEGVDNYRTTRARLTIKATEQTINIQDRRFNCVATRRCATYSGGSVSGNVETGVGLVASQRFADAFLTYFLDSKLANKPESLLDIEGLYAIQNNLDSAFDGRKGQFNFTFDSDSASAQEELFTIADAARCFINKTGSFHEVIRDQAQASPVRMINRSLKKPDSERKSIKFNTGTDFDGVELVYLDFDLDERITITLPDDLPATDSLFGLAATQNPLKVEGIGITNKTQAWDRAQYEFRRLIYNRVSAKVTAGASLATLPINSRVEMSDGTLPADTIGRSDGVVTAVNGLVISTSEECLFSAGNAHEVYLSTENGGTQGPYTVSEVSGDSFAFQLSASASENPYPRGANGYQRGTTYSFRALNETSNAMILQRKTPADDFYYDCELINYSDQYYAADGEDAP